MQRERAVPLRIFSNASKSAAALLQVNVLNLNNEFTVTEHGQAFYGR